MTSPPVPSLSELRAALFATAQQAGVLGVAIGDDPVRRAMRYAFETFASQVDVVGSE